MICSLSGEPTIHPALSLKSKKVFDKKLIREYVQQNGKDPMTGESMTLSDIIPIEISASDIIKGPRKSNQDSIPSMLAMFQNEWDALTLELFDLRKQVTELKKELSLALYRQDAAVNVATAAIKEKNEARKALQQLAMNIGSGNDTIIQNSVKERSEISSELNEEHISSIKREQNNLFVLHKSHKLKPPFTLNISTELSFLARSSFPVSSSTHLFSYNENDNSLLLLSNKDKSGIILSLNEEKSGFKSTVHFVSPDAANIVGVAYLSNKSSGTSESAILVYDNTIAKISKSDGSIHKFLSLSENIIAIAVHPSLPVLISIAQKCFYIYYEKELIYRSSNLSNSAYKCVALHNDGVLAAFGKADASVEIFDICEHRSLLTIMPPVPSEKVSQLYFALNGYWLLIKYGNSLVGIYDLRKGKFEFLLHFPANSPSTPVAMDPSSRILILGPCYAIYEKKTKQWSLPKSLSNLDETNGQHSSLIFTGISGGCYSVIIISGKKLIRGQLSLDK